MPIAEPTTPARALTHTAACAYAPAFADADTVTYDYTSGDIMDLYAVPIAGGAPRQLTSGATMDWRSAPGRRPGEVIFITSDPTRSDNVGGMSVGFLDLATGAVEAKAIPTATAVVAGGVTYYARIEAPRSAASSTARTMWSWRCRRSGQSSP